MNQVPEIARNHDHAEHDEGVFDPVDVAPLISGDTPIITVPASENQNVAKDASGDDEGVNASGQEEMVMDMYNFLGGISEQIRTFNATMQRGVSYSQPPAVPHDKLWDTGLAWEREFTLYPDVSRDVIISPEDEGARCPANLENRGSRNS